MTDSLAAELSNACYFTNWEPEKTTLSTAGCNIDIFSLAKVDLTCKNRSIKFQFKCANEHFKIQVHNSVSDMLFIEFVGFFRQAAVRACM